MTPTHSDGSPGVMLTRRPSSGARRRLELLNVRGPRRGGPRDAGTYNSVNRLCFRKDSRAGGDDSGGDMMG